MARTSKKPRSRAKNPSQSARFLKPTPLDHHFIREWREQRGWSEEKLGQLMGGIGGRVLSRKSIIRLELNQQPYNQHHLEVAALVFGCQAWQLLAGPPLDPVPDEDQWKTGIFELKLTKEQGEAVLNVARQMGGSERASSTNDNFVTPKDISID